MVKHGTGYQKKVDIEYTLGEYRRAYQRRDGLAMQRLELANPELLEEFRSIRSQRDE